MSYRAGSSATCLNEITIYSSSRGIHKYMHSTKSGLRKKTQNEAIVKELPRLAEVKFGRVTMFQELVDGVAFGIGEVNQSLLDVEGQMPTRFPPCVDSFYLVLSGGAKRANRDRTPCQG